MRARLLLLLLPVVFLTSCGRSYYLKRSFTDVQLMRLANESAEAEKRHLDQQKIPENQAKIDVIDKGISEVNEVICQATRVVYGKFCGSACNRSSCCDNGSDIICRGVGDAQGGKCNYGSGCDFPNPFDKWIRFFSVYSDIIKNVEFLDQNGNTLVLKQIESFENPKITVYKIEGFKPFNNTVRFSINDKLYVINNVNFSKKN